MSKARRITNRWPLAAIAALYVGISITGIGWGLPSRSIDRYLFGDDPRWTGQHIAQMADADKKAHPTRAADVDADPLDKAGNPIDLTVTDTDVAAIYLRYRFYTHQPDEMITIMALARMRPGAWDFDPRLYQYGGLFIYPVGAVIGAGSVLGLIDLRSDPAHYLDHPEAIARFYIAARAYVVAWGVIGVLIVFAIGRRLGGPTCGYLSAILFTLLPVVVCMSHEAKPHLPGAVLMLAATWLAMRYAADGRNHDRIGVWIACGAAQAMVLSALPIFVLIPLVEWLNLRMHKSPLMTAVSRALVGACVAGAVYLVCNPYIIINLLFHRDILVSNFGNSLAMYEISRIGAGFTRMLELTTEGATLGGLIVGSCGIALLLLRKRDLAVPLLAPAGLIFVQFVLIGAGKPAEYGRFGVFLDAALVIAAACALTSKPLASHRPVQGLLVAMLFVAIAWPASAYLANFRADATDDNTRTQAAAQLADRIGPIALLAEPAPYCTPPIDFADRTVRLYTSPAQIIEQALESTEAAVSDWPLLIAAVDDPGDPLPQFDLPPGWQVRAIPLIEPGASPARLSRISWANKPICSLEFSPIGE